MLQDMSTAAGGGLVLWKPVLAVMQQRARAAHHEDHIGGQEAPHRVSNQDDVGGRGLVETQPFAKVVSGEVECLVRLVSWIDLGMNNVGGRQLFSQTFMDMDWKGVEGVVVAKKAVDVDNQKSPPGVTFTANTQRVCG